MAMIKPSRQAASSFAAPEPVQDDMPLQPGPQTLGALFWAFTSLALQGFGGVLVIAQRELVERWRWMSHSEFVEEWAVAQTMPGANVINLALVLGERFLGWRGALVAVLGLITLPMCLVLALTLCYQHFQHEPRVAGAFRGIATVAAGLIVATGLKLAVALREHPLGVPLSGAFGAASFVAVALLRWPLAAVLLVLGGTACVLTWQKLAP